MRFFLRHNDKPLQYLKAFLIDLGDFYVKKKEKFFQQY
ncbi:hypothetical protein SAMN05421876_10937 [Kaistella jeonii]|nr:hypothetical protein SAMN05421876_10937 [Kaistella jeonii]VEI97000.1 Uncharacterised protein [Kaistella jeonii]